MVADFGKTYTVDEFGIMISCKARFEPFRTALEQAVFPGCRVLEIGTGVGVFAMLAARYGAGSVVAVEPNPAIEIARQAARDNGLAEQIQFIEGTSIDLEPNEVGRADIVISDLHGTLPFYGQHIPSIIDARTRLLAPGGTLIPRQDRLHAALVVDGADVESSVFPWLENDFGLDLSAGHRYAANTHRSVRVGGGDLLTAPAALGLLDYTRIDSPDLSASTTLPVERPGRAIGILLWFDMEIAEGIDISNHPDGEALVYRQNFFPLERPLDLLVGDRVDLDFGATLRDGNYNFAWESRAFRDGAAEPFARFKQGSVLGSVLSTSMLQEALARTTAGDDTPADAARAALGLLEAGSPPNEVVANLTARFPRSFEAGRNVEKFVENLGFLLTPGA